MPKQYSHAFQTPPFGWLLGGIIVIACIGLWRNYELTRQPKPVAPVSQSEWQKVISPQAMFSTQIFLERDHTYVLLPIRFENIPQTTWLSFDSSSSSSARLHDYLVLHPKLINLSWNRMSQGGIHLYQRVKTISSIDAFLKNPPPKEKIFADYAVMQLPPYNQLAVTELVEDSDLDTADYILTTYVPLTLKDGAYYYENSIDASDAQITDNKMSWSIFVSKASADNPYYLGNIHIDYNRK